MLNKIEKDDFLLLLADRDRQACELLGNKSEFYVGEFGNFSVVVITTKSGLYAGVSKRNPCDRPGDTGQRIAATRAWRDLAGKPAGYSRQHPISKSEAKRISAFAIVGKSLGINLD
jgi:hypothetical protein